MYSIDDTNETIPVTHQQIGTWLVSISRRALSPVQLVDRYDAAASGWDRTAQRFELNSAYRRPLLASGVPKALGAAARVPRVLDCGIGSGSLSMALYPLIAKPIEWYGIDTSTEMLKHARASMRQVGNSVQLQQASVQAIPHPDATFDLVMAAHVLEHLPQPYSALEEMARVLKPGGSLFLCMTRPSLFGALIHLRWRTWAVSETQGVAWLRMCNLSDIGSSRIRLGRLAGWGSTAFWATRPNQRT